MIAGPDLPRAELAQTIVTISTALVAARDLGPADAARLAVHIIREAFDAADALLYELEVPVER